MSAIVITSLTIPNPLYANSIIGINGTGLSTLGGIQIKGSTGNIFVNKNLVSDTYAYASFGGTSPVIGTVYTLETIQANTGTPTDASQTFSFSSLPTPTISGVNPTSAGGGASVTITGTNFDSSSTANNTVNLGTTACTVSSVSTDGTTLVVILPNLSPATYNLQVFRAGNSTGSNIVSFVVTAPQIVMTSIDPILGGVGQEFQIRGQNFGTDITKIQLYFGSVLATLVSTSLNTTSGGIDFQGNVPSGLSPGPVTVGIIINGQSGSNTLTFTYLDATNAIPNQTSGISINAGSNQNLSSGLTTATVTATPTYGSSQTATFTWTQVSGPSVATINSPNTLSTTLSNLISGTYIFQIEAIDGNGDYAFSQTTITIAGGVIVNPSVIAGSNQTIQLPTSTVSLTSTGTPGGSSTIASYTWSKVSGNAGGTITNPNSQNTSVTGLTQGTNVYQITVIDADGGTAAAQTTVVVNPAVSATPVVTSISPLVGIVGSSFTITGTNFNLTNNLVYINGVACSSVLTINSTQIIATVPTGATSGNITLVSNGTVASGIFYYTISALTPISKVYVQTASNTWEDLCNSFIKTASGNWAQVNTKQVYIRDFAGNWQLCTCSGYGPTGWQVNPGSAYCEKVVNSGASGGGLSYPYSVVIDQTTNRAFFANYNSATTTPASGGTSTVSVLDVNPANTSTYNTIIQTITGFTSPRSLVQVGSMIYLLDQQKGLYSINPSTYAVTALNTAIASNTPIGLFYSQYQNLFIVPYGPTQYYAQKLTLSGTAAGLISFTNGATGSYPTSVAEDTTTGNLYFVDGNTGINQVVRVNVVSPTGTTAFATLTLPSPTGDTGRKPAYFPATRTMFVPVQNAQSVYVIDTNPANPTYNTIINTLSLPTPAGNAEYLPQTSSIYIASRQGSNIYQINPSLNNGTIVNTGMAGNAPLDVAYSNAASGIYAANYDSASWTEIKYPNTFINDGKLGYTLLQQYYTNGSGLVYNNGVLVTKPNVSTDINYVAPTLNTTSCPIGV